MLQHTNTYGIRYLCASNLVVSLVKVLFTRYLSRPSFGSSLLSAGSAESIPPQQTTLKQNKLHIHHIFFFSLFFKELYCNISTFTRPNQGSQLSTRPSFFSLNALQSQPQTKSYLKKSGKKDMRYVQVWKNSNLLQDELEHCEPDLLIQPNLKNIFFPSEWAHNLLKSLYKKSKGCYNSKKRRVGVTLC